MRVRHFQTSLLGGGTDPYVAGTGWANVEYRSYHFADEKGDIASIVETKQSRELRRGTEKPLGKAERMELRETASKTWENGGFEPIQAKV